MAPGAERYLIAGNMHNNEELLPHFIIQLVHLFAVLPPQTGFLSIYESGSTDSTGAAAADSCAGQVFVSRPVHLAKRPLLCCRRVAGGAAEPAGSHADTPQDRHRWASWLLALCSDDPSHIRAEPPQTRPAGGSLTRAKDQERIEFLASARNRALEPLWLNSSLASSTSLLLPHEVELLDRRLSAWGLPGGGGRRSSKPMWPAERVVFLNDVYFCARDVVRLLQHDADMVCGMDFDRPKLEEMPWEVCWQDVACAGGAAWAPAEDLLVTSRHALRPAVPAAALCGALGTQVGATLAGARAQRHRAPHHRLARPARREGGLQGVLCRSFRLC